MNADQGVRIVLFAKSVAIYKIAKSVAIEASQESFLKPQIPNLEIDDTLECSNRTKISGTLKLNLISWSFNGSLNG